MLGLNLTRSKLGAKKRKTLNTGVNKRKLFDCSYLEEEELRRSDSSGEFGKEEGELKPSSASASASLTQFSRLRSSPNIRDSICS